MKVSSNWMLSGKLWAFISQQKIHVDNFNLFRFKYKSEYADGSDADLSGAKAYARYGKGIQACLAAVDGKQIYAGPVTGLMIGEVEELWDMVALVEYPSLAAMQKMMSSPEYRAIEVHRKAGLAGQLNIRTSQIGRWHHETY